MLKRDEADKYYSVAIKKIRSEHPEASLTNEDCTAVFETIYSMLNKGNSRTDVLDYIHRLDISDLKKRG